MSEAQYKIINGEAIKVLSTMDDATFDAVITDPPYSSGGQYRGDRAKSTRDKYQGTNVIIEHPSFSGDNRDQRSWAHWCVLWLGECLRVTKPGGVLCMFCDWRQLPAATDAVQAGGWVWRGIVPWDKVVARPSPGRFRAQAEYMVWGTNGAREFEFDNATYMDGFFRVRTVATNERVHATQKPIELMRQIVPIVPEGGIVLDPFCGSGSTGIAAVSLGRRFVGIELDQAYAERARAMCESESTQAKLFVGGAA